MSTPWTLTVLRAFRDAMNAVKLDDVPDAFIGWPHLGMNEGPWSPFVWFDHDPIETHDGADNHELVVVTGIVFDRDPSKVNQTILEQAIIAYYALRAALAEAIENNTSDFNQAFPGQACPHPEQGGVRPSGAKDFDGKCSMGERWLVVGSAGTTGTIGS